MSDGASGAWCVLMNLASAVGFTLAAMRTDDIGILFMCAGILGMAAGRGRR